MDATSIFRTSSKLFLESGMSVLTLVTPAGNVFKLRLATVHALDYDKLKKLRPENIVLKASMPEATKHIKTFLRKKCFT